MKYIWIIILTLSFNFCAEHFDSNFKNYNEMISSDSYKKGWIPKIIPESAVNIHEWHDLDTNLGYGSFEFDTAELESFLSGINSIEQNEIKVDPIFDLKNNWDYNLSKKPSYQKIIKSGFKLYKYDIFYIAVNRVNGHGLFWHKY